jgi:hypothetical protein
MRFNTWSRYKIPGPRYSSRYKYTWAQVLLQVKTYLGPGIFQGTNQVFFLSF